MQGQHQKKRDARLESLPCFVAYSKKKRKGSGVSYIGTSNIELHNIVWTLLGGGRGGKAVIFPGLKTAKCLANCTMQLTQYDNHFQHMTSIVLHSSRSSFLKFTSIRKQ